MNDLEKIDNNFISSDFISSVENVFIQINISIMNNNLEEIDHFVDDQIYKKLKNILDNLNLKNQVLIFKEINIKQTKILRTEKLDNKYIAKVNISSNYISYIIDKNTKLLISGDPNKIIEKENYLTFEKKIDVEAQNEARKCDNCGANMDINNSGKCNYCGAIYDLENHSWIMTDLKTMEDV